MDVIKRWAYSLSFEFQGHMSSNRMTILSMGANVESFVSN